MSFGSIHRASGFTRRDAGPAPSPLVIGLDLGQQSDPTALAIIKRTPVLDAAGRPAQTPRGWPACRSDVVHLARYPLGTPYPAIVADLGAMLARPELQHAPESDRPGRPLLAVDATGVGRAVVDMFIGAKAITSRAKLVPVTITAGEGSRRDSWPGLGGAAYWVAKRELVGSIQAGLQSRSLLIVPSLDLADVLKRELMDFKIKVTTAANETFNAREGAHDDLVLAVALALWTAENVLPQPRDWFIV